jgi:ribose-phosphate pyrophosphokinase
MTAPERVPLVFALPRFASLMPRSPALERAKIKLSHFANGELDARLRTPVEGRDCFVLGTAAPPALHLARLLLACDTLTRHGAASVHALLPYLAYTRQDREQSGCSLAAAWLGRLLAASGISDVTTIDIHSEHARALIGLPVRSLSPAPLFAAALPELHTGAVVVAPDRGAIERARAMADALELDAPVTWIDKVRKPRGVVHRRVVGELAPRAIVVDDILDTGDTLVSCAQQLRAQRVDRLEIAVTHGLFTGDRWRALTRLGVDAIHVTDSVPDARRYASRIVRIQSILPLIEMAVVEPQAGMPSASTLTAPAAGRTPGG